MSEQPSENSRERRRKKADPNLPDDEAIRRLFPKRVVDRVNREIGHKPASESDGDDDANSHDDKE